MNGKSGKLVAPAVALMLCAVALVGVGFAISLNSTSTADGNEITNIDGLVLNLTGDSSSNKITGGAAVYYETVQTGINGSTEYNLAKSETMPIATGKAVVKTPEYGKVTLTYKVSNVVFKFNNANVTLGNDLPVLYINGTEVTCSGGDYILNNQEITTSSDVDGQDFTIGISAGGKTITLGTLPTGGNSPTVTMTFDLEVSAAYATA